MQNYSKAIAAFIGSLIALLSAFGIHTGIFADPTLQNTVATVLALLVPAIAVYFAPANKPTPSVSAGAPASVHAATAAAAAQVAINASEVAKTAAGNAVAAALPIGRNVQPAPVITPQQ